MKKTVTALLLCGSALLAQGPAARGAGPGGPGGPGDFGGRGGGMEMLGSDRVVTGAPYSAVEVLTIQEKFADGNSVNTTTSTPRARDGQGRTYVSETVTPASGKPAYTRITIMDPVAGFRYDLNSSTMIAVQSRLPQMRSGPPFAASQARSAPQTMTRPNGATVTTSSQGTANVNGVPAVHTLVTEVIPAGAIGNALAITTSRTMWVSPELKIPVQIKTSDPRVGTSDVELTGITMGEPSATLFAVPSGYTIQKANGRGPGGPGGYGRQGGGGSSHAGDSHPAPAQ